jgi:hypothetical protein
MRTGTRVGVLFVAAATVVLGACGSSSKSSNANAGTSATTSTMMGSSETTMGMNEGTTAPGTVACAMTMSHTGDTYPAVTLKEWAITVGTPSANKVGGFDVKNTGTEEHELAIVQSSEASLPKASDGSVDEMKLGNAAIIARVRVGPGKECVLDDALTPGTYTLICNIVETMGTGETHVHYAKGMHTTFRVTP